MAQPTLPLRFVRWFHARGWRPPGQVWLDAMETYLDAEVGTVCAENGPAPTARPFTDQLRAARGYYRRHTLAYVDPHGDAELIRFHDRSPYLIVNVWWRDRLRRAHGDGVPSPHFRASWSRPLDVERLYAECVRVISDAGYPPFIGPEHRWSDEAAAYLRRDWCARLVEALRDRSPLPMPLCGASKLLVLLGWGTTARWAPTGFERSLRTRLLDYADRTVQPADVFREAYGLCGGDLYLTLLTALNVLCDRHWRPDRNTFPLHRKLVYLRKDSTAEGDNFGVWYHFFGSALFGLKRRRWQTRSVGLMAAMLDLIFVTADPQKTWSNLIGAELGARLRRVAQTERVASAPRPGVSAARADGGPDLMRTS